MSDLIKALIINAGDGGHELMEANLKRHALPSFEVTSVKDAPGVEKLIANGGYDIALCASLSKVRNEEIIRGSDRMAPILVVSNGGDETMAVSAIKAGAIDFIAASAHNFAEMPRIVIQAVKEWRELREKEKAGAEREAQYRDMLDNFGDVFIRFNAEMRITYASASIKNALGREPGELIGKNISEADNAAFSKVMEKLFSSAVNRKQAVDSEYETTAGGGGKYYDIRIFPEFDGGGRFLSALCVMHDITEIKRKFREAYSDMQRFQMVARQIPIIVWSTREDMKLDFILSKDIVTKSGMNWMPDDLFKAYGFNRQLNDEHKKALAGNINVFEVGSNIGTFEVRIEPFKNSAGKVCGTFGLAYNISDRKKIENELRSAKISAEAANHTKSMFLANTSHELRTPMNGILGFIELLYTTELSEEQKDYVATLQNSATHLMELIHSMLYYSDIESGIITHGKKVFSPSSIAEECRKIMSTFNKKGIEKIVEIDENLNINLIGDPPKISQALVNLISNAFKFTPAGKVGLRARLNGVSNNIAELEYEVFDTGIGIEKDRIEEIYQLFHQLEPPTRKSYEGMGIGLSIVKRLVDFMGGELSVSSEPEKGSSFKLTLKLEVAGKA